MFSNILPSWTILLSGLLTMVIVKPFYLEDLEGNGIELYRDKPVAEWDIREDGRIVGVTEELSAQEIYEMGRKVEPFVLAKDTRMGHIHLSVKDSQLARTFYQDVLKLADKFTIPKC